MDRAVRAWGQETGRADDGVVAVGYFGSYARGDWGVGSDVDLVVILRSGDEAFERRSLAYDLGRLPVPADLFVYTVDEWERMSREGGLPRAAANEMVWVFER